MEKKGQSLAKGLLLVGAATMLANGAAYLLSMIGARALSVSGYGALGAMLSISVIGSTIAIAVQTVGARRLASQTPGHANSPTEIASLTGQASAAMLLLGLVLSLPLAFLLNVPSLAALLNFGAIAASIPGFAGLGILQGGEDHRGFGIAYTGIGVLRAAGGIAAMLVVPTVTSACLGIFFGTLLGSALSMAVARLPLSTSWIPGPLTGELLHTSSALVALFALANSDVLLARLFLNEYSSGEYAVGALIAKIAFFLPYAIITIYFPKMNVQDGKTAAFRIALLMTMGVGALITVVCFLFSGPLVLILAGDKYADLAPLAWMFALEGAVLAVIQVVLYAGFSARAKIVGLLPLIALVAQLVVVAAWGHESVGQIVTVTIAAAALAALVGIWLELRRPNRRDLNRKTRAGTLAGDPLTEGV